MSASGKGNVYEWKGFKASTHHQNIRIIALENYLHTFTPLDKPEIIQELTYLMQGTQFAKLAGVGDKRSYANTAPSSIDEETLASVVAYATFDDIGGNATPVATDPGSSIDLSFTSASFTVASFASAFLTPEFKVPMHDNEGRTAYYTGHYRYLNWSAHLAPEVTHTKQFMLGHSLELNVPGTATDDRYTFAYYDSHANFNVSSSISSSIWIYPTDMSVLGANTGRYIHYRRIDASNYWILFIATTTSNQIKIFVNEAGALTRVLGAAPTLNAWNNIVWTYNPSTNALVLYVNNVSSTTTSGTTETPAYTVDANMYLGGVPGLPDKRFTGYMDNFVMWSGKILTAGEVTNMWNRGTIV